MRCFRVEPEATKDGKGDDRRFKRGAAVSRRRRGEADAMKGGKGNEGNKRRVKREAAVSRRRRGEPDAMKGGKGNKGNKRRFKREAAVLRRRRGEANAMKVGEGIRDDDSVFGFTPPKANERSEIWLTVSEVIKGSFLRYCAKNKRFPGFGITVLSAENLVLSVVVKDNIVEPIRRRLRC